MSKAMTMAVVLCSLTGCASEAPVLSNLMCNPSPFSAAAPGPYSLTCHVEFEGKPGDVSWHARAVDGAIWASGTDSLDSNDRSTGKYTFGASMIATPPAVGTMTVTLTADHVDGIDGPEGDTITLQIEVVP